MSDYSPILLELAATRSSLNRVARACRLGMSGDLTSDNNRRLSSTVFYLEEALKRIKNAEDMYRTTLEDSNA